MSESTAIRWVLATLATLIALPLAVVVALIATDEAAPAAGAIGGALRPDAPIPPDLVAWVIRAGSLCPEVTPAAIAAQIDLESSWNPNAYADSGEVPAKGIAQFTDATWATWGGDYNGNGINSPYDPQDAIYAQGRLMCDLVKWSKDNLAAGRLRGEVIDLAWAAYFQGRGGILAAGGVPASGLAHDYPQQVRARIPKYAAATVVPDGAWTQPVHASVGSAFRSSSRPGHDGVDLSAARGTPILAASAGTVILALCNAGNGNCDVDGSESVSGCGWYVEVLHSRNIVTRYCHMLRRPAVRVGQAVQGGQLLGYVGSSGNSSGPHLHFEVHVGNPATSGNATDPVPFMIAAGAPLGR